ncbi:uncharacterized protein YjbJ (UPF0337 family) [Rhodanobacter sp. MP1X3]|nr:uncharacterized protein YjbJ (UPF0337 family) [Rhodanobacter sp. MP1X3]
MRSKPDDSPRLMEQFFAWKFTSARLARPYNIPAAKVRHYSGPTMDKNRTEGAKHEVKGAIKEGIGKVTGNKSKEVAGNAEKNAGKVQHAVGKAADKAREDAKRH